MARGSRGKQPKDKEEKEKIVVGWWETATRYGAEPAGELRARDQHGTWKAWERYARRTARVRGEVN